jgi:hypothetical protein
MSVMPEQESPILIIEDPYTRSRRPRYTIGGFMILIAVVAGLCALPTGLALLLIPLSIPCLAVAIARRMFLRRRLRLAAYSFWGLAIAINTLTAFSCITPNSHLLRPIFLGLIFIGLPTIVALGTAWAVMFARQSSVTRQTSDAAGMAIFVLTILPIVTLWSLWPLHLAFLISRPAMTRLADQVAAGMAVEFPQRIGLFSVVSAAVSPVSSDVGLMLKPSPRGLTGFVRARPGSAPKSNGLIAGSNLNVGLGDGWSYREDD